MNKGIPVGIERVLVVAAADEGFREALISGDRVAEAEARGLTLRRTERAMLQSVPEEQLTTYIRATDVSQRNVARRSFLRTVAAGAAVVAAADTVAGCSDDSEKPPQPDHMMATGIRPDMTPPAKDAGPPVDSVKVLDKKAWPDHLGSFGNRPNG